MCPTTCTNSFPSLDSTHHCVKAIVFVLVLPVMQLAGVTQSSTLKKWDAGTLLHYSGISALIHFQYDKFYMVLVRSQQKTGGECFAFSALPMFRV